ncbi:MAG: hypothetical protein IH621_16030 [Krumholzibacteria bacterium]|nr:hypothetical protein [Candidatus Krumholzibacteria bacterium]
MTRCFEPREIARALDLPEGDPGRRHLDRCPRCRSLALAYYEFMETPDAVDVEFSTADRDLQGRMAEAFTDRRHGRRPWWRVEWPRPIWATAAVALAAAAVLLLTGDLGRLGGGDLPAAGGVLRGEDPTTGLVAVRGAAGLTVSWAADPAAEEVVIVFYDKVMAEIGHAVATGTRLEFGAGDPRAVAAYCQLLRIAEGDTLARSAVVAPRPARE